MRQVAVLIDVQLIDVQNENIPNPIFKWLWGKKILKECSLIIK